MKSEPLGPSYKSAVNELVIDKKRHPTSFKESGLTEHYKQNASVLLVHSHEIIYLQVKK